jgi:hypothetical protein
MYMYFRLQVKGGRLAIAIEVSSFERLNGVSAVPSPEDENRSSFRNVLPSSLLIFWTMDKVLKLNDT